MMRSRDFSLTISPQIKVRDPSGERLLLGLFYIWAFVMLGRPQDLLPVFRSLRPALLLSVLVVAVLCFKCPAAIHRLLSRNRQVTLFLVLFLVAVAGIPLAIYRWHAFTSVAGYLNVLLFVFLMYAVVDSIEKIRKLLSLATVGAGLYALFALLSGNPETRYSFSNMFDPNDIVYALLSFLPFNFIFLTKDSSQTRRLVAMTNIAASVLLILLSASRGGFVSLVTVLLTLLLFSRTISRSLKTLFVAVCVVFVLFSLSKIDVDRYKTIADLGTDYNVTDEFGRLAIWRNGLDMILSNPLTGVGVGCFGQAIGENRQSKKLLAKWQEPHNSIVQIAAETGVIGLLLYVILTLRSFAIFARVRNDGGSKGVSEIGEMALIGFLGNFAASMFLSQAYSMYFGFYVALSAVLLRLTEDPNPVNDQAASGRVSNKLNGRRRDADRK